MRWLLSIVWLVLAIAGAWAADMVILVDAREAGPILHEGMYQEPTWILWPVSSGPDQANRFLSLASGVDWQAPQEIPAFTVRNGVAQNSESVISHWRNRGYFEAVVKNVGGRRMCAIAPEPAAVRQRVLLSAWTKTKISIVGKTDPFPAQSMVVAGATGANPWDEVARLVDRAGGRVLVIEVPAEAGDRWSRFWLMGEGWPEGVPKTRADGIPGLVEAHNLYRLFNDNPALEWQPPIANPPQQWLTFGHRTAPIVLVFLAVASVYILGLAVFMVLREQASRTSMLLLRLVVIGPAAIVLAGRLTSLTDLAKWVYALPTAFVGLSFGAWALNWTARQFIEDCHPLWGEFVVGLFTLAGINPVWSMFTNVLGPHRAPINPEAFGAFVAYAVGSNYLFSDQRGTRSVWGLVAASLTLDLMILSRWATPLNAAAIPVTVAALCRPILRKPLLWVVAMVAVGLLGAFYLPGLVYAPDHLVYNFRQVGKFNCAEQIAFLRAPMFISVVLISATIAFIGDKFLGHQVRRAMAFSPKPKLFFYAAMGFAIAGVFIPLYLHAALATVILGGITVLFDAVRSP